jgi:hypothetical protein
MMGGGGNIVHILTVLAVQCCQHGNLTPVGNVRLYGHKFT